MIDDGAQRLLARILQRRSSDRRIFLRILAERIEVVETEHVVEERPHAALQARTCEHTIHLLLATALRVELAFLGSVQQFLIGHGVPQKETEPRSQSIVIEPAMTLP